jgi:hypothetical protein
MKKASIVLFVLFFAAITHSFAQTTTATMPAPVATTTTAAPDFFAGKWELLIVGTPQGDAKMIANFTRKDGKLIGEMSDPTDAQKEKTPITNIEEEATKITIYFSASGYDLNVPLEKVDEDNLKGKLMDMFETTAKRIK